MNSHRDDQINNSNSSFALQRKKQHPYKRFLKIINMTTFCVISFSGNTSYFALMIGLSFSILQYITSSFCFPQRFYKTLLYFIVKLGSRPSPGQL